MSTDYLVELFEYDSTVNRELLDALRASANLSERAMAIFAHLLSAKKVWMERWDDSPANSPIWPSLDFSRCQALIDQNRRSYKGYLWDMSKSDMMDTVQYQNSKGAEFMNRVRDGLLHVLTHSGYHRGQIAQLIRQEGGGPINSGYIFYLRDRA
jgi:uncharacterized damage-inducible protein DinB